MRLTKAGKILEYAKSLNTRMAMQVIENNMDVLTEEQKVFFDAFKYTFHTSYHNLAKEDIKKIIHLASTIEINKNNP